MKTTTKNYLNELMEIEIEKGNQAIEIKEQQEIAKVASAIDNLIKNNEVIPLSEKKEYITLSYNKYNAIINIHLDNARKIRNIIIF